MKRIAPFAPPHLACWIIREVAAGAGADRTGPWYENGQILSPRSKPTRALRELITRNEYPAPGFDANADTIETSWNTPRSPRFRGTPIRPTGSEPASPTATRIAATSRP